MKKETIKVENCFHHLPECAVLIAPTDLPCDCGLEKHLSNFKQTLNNLIDEMMKNDNA